jgi:DNA-binding protein HU-beta
MLDLQLKNLFHGMDFPTRPGGAVNRSELIDRVASDTGLDKRRAEGAVAAFIDSVIDETRGGSKVSIFGFGIFTPTSRAARMGRNPQTGAPVRIAASKGVRFAPAAAYKEALNRGGAKKATAKSPAKKSAAKKSPAKRAAVKKGTVKKAAKSARK